MRNGDLPRAPCLQCAIIRLVGHRARREKSKRNGLLTTKATLARRSPAFAGRRRDEHDVCAVFFRCWYVVLVVSLWFSHFFRVLLGSLMEARTNPGPAEPMNSWDILLTTRAVRVYIVAERHV